MNQVNLGHLNVLVAEDNAVNQMVIKGHLKKLGIKPVIVQNGLEVVEAMEDEQCHWDLILMDCEMPVMDGFEATKQIRVNEKSRADRPILIVGLSAHALDISRNKAMAIGMDEYLTKPIDFNLLTETLNKYHFSQS